jgi:hypothetical protein
MGVGGQVDGESARGGGCTGQAPAHRQLLARACCGTATSAFSLLLTKYPLPLTSLTMPGAPVLVGAEGHRGA